MDAKRVPALVREPPYVKLFLRGPLISGTDPDRAETAPRFATHGDGKVIKVDGEFGVDYAFLSRVAAEATAEEARFAGTAASVQAREESLVLALGEAGSVAYGQRGLSADSAVSARFTGKRVILHLADNREGSELKLTVDGDLTPITDGVRVRREPDAYQVVIPAGLDKAEFAVE